MISAKRAKRASVALLGLMALAGCGGGGGPTHGNGPRGVFTSTNDCADYDKFDFKSCSEAVRTAIKIHNEEGATYEGRRFCKAKELGCERTLNNKFRPRLLGFYVELPEKAGEKIIGKPLYAMAGKKKGFRDHEKVSYLEKDLSLVFSRRAIAVYKTHSVVKRSVGFGT